MELDDDTLEELGLGQSQWVQLTEALYFRKMRAAQGSEEAVINAAIRAVKHNATREERPRSPEAVERRKKKRRKPRKKKKPTRTKAQIAKYRATSAAWDKSPAGRALREAQNKRKREKRAAKKS